MEPFSPQVVGSFSPLESDAPVYNQVHQEQIVTGEMTLNIVEHPAVQELVTVQEIPQVSVVERIQELCSLTGLMNPLTSTSSLEAPRVVGSLPPFEEFPEPVYNQVHQEQMVAGEMTQNIIENSAVQEHAIVREIPVVVERIQEQIVETIDVTPQGSQIALSSSSTSTSSDRRLDEFARMLDSCIELLTPVTAQIDGIEKETERAAMLTKRMLETPSPEPPLLEPPTVQPPMVEPDRTSAKRRRRTRYTPLPGIMAKAVYLAPSAWPPVRHA